MSVLVLSIQGLVTERAACSADAESVLKGANSMKVVRTALANTNEVQAAATDLHTSRFAASMQAPIAVVRSALEVPFARCFQAVTQLRGRLLGGLATARCQVVTCAAVCLSDAAHLARACVFYGPDHER